MQVSSSPLQSCKCLTFCWPLRSRGTPHLQPPVPLPWRPPLPFKVWNATFHKIRTESRLIIRKGLSVSLEHSVSINTLRAALHDFQSESEFGRRVGTTGAQDGERSPRPRVSGESRSLAGGVLAVYTVSTETPSASEQPARAPLAPTPRLKRRFPTDSEATRRAGAHLNPDIRNSCQSREELDFKEIRVIC